MWLQGDNCPKEVRNSFIGKWSCLLAQANYFVGASHHHMVVGHTHEDIGLVNQFKLYGISQISVYQIVVIEI